MVEDQQIDESVADIDSNGDQPTHVTDKQRKGMIDVLMQSQPTTGNPAMQMLTAGSPKSEDWVFRGSWRSQQQVNAFASKTGELMYRQGQPDPIGLMRIKSFCQANINGAAREDFKEVMGVMTALRRMRDWFGGGMDRVKGVMGSGKDISNP